jgi:uncharacterized protein (UPF0332 family)
MTDYLDRALQAAASARNMRDDGDFNAACNRAYYAMFYAVHALFEASGEQVSAKTHASILRLFSQRFVATGLAPPELARALTAAQNLRSKADYSVDGTAASEADDAIAAMESLLNFAKPALGRLKKESPR